MNHNNNDRKIRKIQKIISIVEERERKEKKGRRIKVGMIINNNVIFINNDVMGRQYQNQKR